MLKVYSCYAGLELYTKFLADFWDIDPNMSSNSPTYSYFCWMKSSLKSSSSAMQKESPGIYFGFMDPCLAWDEDAKSIYKT